MAANTSQIADWIARLAALGVNAISLVQKGKRSPEMVETLIHALQLFKENRLRDVSILSPEEKRKKESEREARMRRNRQAFFRRFARKKDHQYDVPFAVLSPSARLSTSLYRAVRIEGGVRNLLKSGEEFARTALGDRSVDELIGLLEEHGLYFGMTTEELYQAFRHPDDAVLKQQDD